MNKIVNYKKQLVIDEKRKEGKNIRQKRTHTNTHTTVYFEMSLV